MNLSEAIRRDLEKLHITSTGGLLVSGDLTWKATSEEFEWAAKFVDDVKSWSTLTASQVLVCPGNHDLAFSNEPWRKGTKADVVDASSAAAFKSFYERLFSVSPTATMSSGRRMWLPNGQVADIVSRLMHLCTNVEEGGAPTDRSSPPSMTMRRCVGWWIKPLSEGLETAVPENVSGKLSKPHGSFWRRKKASVCHTIRKPG